MSRVPTDSNIAHDPSSGRVEPLGCCRQHVDVQLMWNALLDVSYGEVLTSNAFPLKKVRCIGSFNVSGRAVRLNYAVQRIAA